MKLAVTVFDASMAANVGGQVYSEVKTFPMPEEVAALIHKWTGTYMHVTLAPCMDDEILKDKP
jgi:hypothetical protein